MARQIITVFGGSGFVGRHLVKRLTKRGYTVRVAVRDVEAAMFLKPMADAGQIVPFPCNIRSRADVEAALSGAVAAVNLVGILSEWGQQTFKAIHLNAATMIAEVAAAQGIRRFVHMSALGANTESDAVYARTKGEAEVAVRAVLPEAVVIRPSVIFGPEDNFFNMFADLSRLAPVLPVVGGEMTEKGVGGGTKFQPVYVGDVAEAMAVALDHPNAAGQTFELGGPSVYAFAELMDLMLEITRRKRFLMPVAFPIAMIKATFLGLLPKPLLTRDQVKMLRHDNVLNGEHPGLDALGIEPQTVEAIVPTYLAPTRGGNPIKQPA